jgi:bifunctional UDP-N-acetylglucosamine pyrophosphorylase/glucosamine-1-phosphate N-acetyltransferase
MEEPFGYGRILKNNGKFQGIVEEKDADLQQKEIKEINTGTYCFQGAVLKKGLANIQPQNAQREYYLTDIFDIFLASGDKVETVCTQDFHEAMGINDRLQLSEAEQIIYDQIRKYWMTEGVTIINPLSVLIDSQVKLSKDVIIYPYTIIQGTTMIEEGSQIGPGTRLENCTCLQDCRIENSVAKEAIIGESCVVGPFAYLRPGTVLAKGVKVGDFVEIKKSHIGEGSKVPHLSYIGDSSIGKNVNIGAGTITCNYDGKLKHQPIIGDNVFVGSNTNFVAPVEVGNESVIGAGSTITRNVPENALAVERSQQRIINNWLRAKDK